MRDFIRAAVFFFIVPFFAALSIALKSVESFAADAFASFVAMSFDISLTTSFTAFLRRALKTRRLKAPRCAFFADDVFATVVKSYPKCSRYAIAV